MAGLRLSYQFNNLLGTVYRQVMPPLKIGSARAPLPPAEGISFEH